MDPRGNAVYWIGAEGNEDIAGPGTDFNAIANRKMSITPIRLDMTEENSLEFLSSWTKDFSLT